MVRMGPCSVGTTPSAGRNTLLERNLCTMSKKSCVPVTRNINCERQQLSIQKHTLEVQWFSITGVRPLGRHLEMWGECVMSEELGDAAQCSELGILMCPTMSQTVLNSEESSPIKFHYGPTENTRRSKLGIIMKLSSKMEKGGGMQTKNILF